MTQVDPENTLAEPILAYANSTRNKDPYFFDPLGDIGFKRLFAAQQNTDFSISFINHVLEGKRQVVSLEVLKNEYPGDTFLEGGVVIDMVCKDENGRFFLVEMQRKLQANFKERSLFYASRLITEQAPRGNRKQWAYALKDVYVIALLEEFTIGTDADDSWLHDIALVHTGTGKVFSERLAFTYIEFCNFSKTVEQLASGLEQWIYALKHLNHLKKVPDSFTEPELVQFCEAARYINLTKKEKDMISAKTKQRWDYYSVMKTEKDLSREEGAHENALKTAIKLKKKGASAIEIAELTELSLDEIEKL